MVVDAEPATAGNLKAPFKERAGRVADAGPASANRG